MATAAATKGVTSERSTARNPGPALFEVTPAADMKTAKLAAQSERIVLVLSLSSPYFWRSASTAFCPGDEGECRPLSIKKNYGGIAPPPRRTNQPSNPKTMGAQLLLVELSALSPSVNL